MRNPVGHGRASPAYELLETMRFDPVAGLTAAPLHLDRLEASAAALGFSFDRGAAAQALLGATCGRSDPGRVRLRLAPTGAIRIEVGDPPAPPTALPVQVALSPLPVDPSDFRLRHKTSDRSFYDDARARAGCFEVIFTLPDGRLTEGSFTNVFVERGGRLLTPPLALGLLPGVMRRSLIESGRAVEALLTAADLESGFMIGNALRGLLPAALTGTGSGRGSTTD